MMVESVRLKETNWFWIHVGHFGSRHIISNSKISSVISMANRKGLRRESRVL